MQKYIPRQKVFGNSEFCSSRLNHSRPNSLENCSLGGKNKTQSFQKLFVGGYLFVFVEYLCNCSLKIKTKNIKNYRSILASVNHRNWLDDSPPLIGTYVDNCQNVVFVCFSMLIYGVFKYIFCPRVMDMRDPLIQGSAT